MVAKGNVQRPPSSSRTPRVDLRLDEGVEQLFGHGLAGVSPARRRTGVITIKEFHDDALLWITLLLDKGFPCKFVRQEAQRGHL